MCAHWELCRRMKIGQRSPIDWCCLLSTGGWFTIWLCKKYSDYVLFKIPPWSRQAVWHPWRKLDVSGDRRSLQGVLPHHTTLPYLYKVCSNIQLHDLITPHFPILWLWLAGRGVLPQLGGRHQECCVSRPPAGPPGHGQSPQYHSIIGPLEWLFHFSCPGWRRVGGAVFLPP